MDGLLGEWEAAAGAEGHLGGSLSQQLRRRGMLTLPPCLPLPRPLPEWPAGATYKGPFAAPLGAGASAAAASAATSTAGSAAWANGNPTASLLFETLA